MRIANIMTTLASSGDVGAEMAALAVQSGQEQKQVARAARDADAAIEEHEEDQEVAAMHQQADDIRSEALVEGLGTIAEGVATGASAFAGKTWGPVCQAAGTAVSGTSRIVGADRGAARANDDAVAAQHKAAAEHAKSAAGDMHDASRDAADYVKSALDFYREYVSTEAESRAAAVHRA